MVDDKGFRTLVVVGVLTFAALFAVVLLWQVMAVIIAN
jgi:hypothetical protein